ncbi:MAG: helix-turn-helix transcriptional regulator [Chitinophagaceae bacterium]
MSQVKDAQLLQKISLVLKDLRDAAAKTQADVFGDTNIHIARIESGSNNPTISSLSALCDYFGISLVDFFKRVEKINSPRPKA